MAKLQYELSDLGQIVSIKDWKPLSGSEVLDKLNELAAKDTEIERLRADIDAVKVWLCDWDEDIESVEDLAKNVCGLLKHRGSDLVDARIEIERLREENNGLAARVIVWSENDKRLRSALELPLMFHAGGAWTADMRRRWKEITGDIAGGQEATTKIMCDAIRAALATDGGEL